MQATKKRVCKSLNPAKPPAAATFKNSLREWQARWKAQRAAEGRGKGRAGLIGVDCHGESNAKHETFSECERGSNPRASLHFSTKTWLENIRRSSRTWSIRKS